MGLLEHLALLLHDSLPQTLQGQMRSEQFEYTNLQELMSDILGGVWERDITMGVLFVL